MNGNRDLRRWTYPLSEILIFIEGNVVLINDPSFFWCRVQPCGLPVIMLPPLLGRVDVSILWRELALYCDPIIGAVISTWPDVDVLAHELWFRMAKPYLFCDSTFLDVLEHTVEAIRVDNSREVWYNLVLPFTFVPAFLGSEKH